jgi:signal transduction histidine kinase
MAEINLERYRRMMLAIPIASALLLFFLAYLYYDDEKNAAANEAYRDLKSVGHLKATQISSWYNERYRDAVFYSSSNIILNEIAHTNNDSLLPREPLLKLFETVRHGNIYEEILVVDSNGNLIFSLNPSYKIDEAIKEHISSMMLLKKITTQNLIYCSLHMTVHNDVIAPLIVDGTIKGALIMRIDPYEFIYPYIQEWPVPSLTAETILVTKEGDSVLFLNEVKKISNLALKYKVPFSDTIHPSVAAVLGQSGQRSGYDYVGDKVLSHVSRIEGTPWYLVVKIDQSEAYKDVLVKTGMIVGMSVLTILLITSGLVFGYKRRQEIAQRLLEAKAHMKFSSELKEQVNERTSELQKLNEDLLSFTHIVSHDLKEPVRKIKFFVSVVKTKLGPDIKADEHFQKVEASAARLYTLVDGIEKYIEVQDTQLLMELIDLNECVDLIRNDLELLIKSKGGEIIAGNLPWIEGIKLLISKLFYNLFENSLKFSNPDVPPIIKVDSVNRVINGKQYIELTVSDNGIGFDPQYAEKIFHSFTRLHPKDKFEGTGLGLTLCKKIVERHKGNIVARSNNDSGASFHILLPIRQH